MTHECPICGGCRAKERARLMWMAIGRLGILEAEELRILHLAPEKAIGNRLVARYGDGYHATDIEPERFRTKRFAVHRLDLCDGLGAYADGSFDLILHNHVLEHVPCDVYPVLADLQRMLAPGGWHVFTVPFERTGAAITDEDLDPALSEEERIRRFGQRDHVRIFGKRDFPDRIERDFGIRPLDVGALISAEELERAAIPKGRTALNGHTPLVGRG